MDNFNASSHLSSAQRFSLLGAAYGLMFLCNRDYIAVNLALTAIGKDIQAPLEHLQWLLSCYVLALGACVMLGGRLSDCYGKRWALLWGVALFMGGSFWAGFNNYLPLLIVGRVMQGVGAALFTPAAYALVFAVVPPAHQGLAMGGLVGSGGLGLSVGSPLAGLLLHHLSWRWVFYLNLPLGIILFLIFWGLLTPERKPARESPPEFLGAILLGLGLIGLTYALNQIEAGNLWIIWMGGGSFCLSLFWYYNSQTSTPVVPKDFWRNKPLMAAAAAAFLLSFIFSMFFLCLGLYLQNILRLPSYKAGLLFLNMTLAYGCLSPLGGKIIDKWGMLSALVLSVTFLVIAFSMMGQLTFTHSFYYLATSFVIAGVGLGIVSAVANAAMLWSAPAGQIGAASGFFNTTLMIGNAVGVAGATTLLVMLGHVRLKALPNIPPEAGAMLTQPHLIPSAAPPTLLQALDEAFLYGFSWNMRLGVLFALLVGFLGIYWFSGLKPPPPSQANSLQKL